jgi:hypothetical protein
VFRGDLILRIEFVIFPGTCSAFTACSTVCCRWGVHNRGAFGDRPVPAIGPRRRSCPLCPPCAAGRCGAASVAAAAADMPVHPVALVLVGQRHGPARQPSTLAWTLAATLACMIPATLA